MVNFPKNIKKDTEPECYSCCGTTCDRIAVIAQHRQLEANNHELGRTVKQFYKWYLGSQEDNEKLRIELTATKKELAYERENSTSHTVKSPAGPAGEAT